MNKTGIRKKPYNVAVSVSDGLNGEIDEINEKIQEDVAYPYKEVDKKIE